MVGPPFFAPKRLRGPALAVAQKLKDYPLYDVSEGTFPLAFSCGLGFS